MAIDFAQSGRLEDAIEQCRKSLSVEPRQATLQLLLGNLLSDTGKPEQAIAPFELALQIDPALPDAQFSLGLAHGQLGHFEQAADWFEKVVSTRKNDAQAHFNLGMAREQHGRIADAIESYRLAVAVDPDLADGEKALQLAERAAALTKHRNAEILDTLAAAYASVGQYERAVETAQRAIELAEDIPQLSTQLRERLKSYEQDEPYREGAAETVE